MYDEYLNEDGTYTSPKNGKVYKTRKALISHLSYKSSTRAATLAAMSKKKTCTHCNKKVTVGNIERHEETCYLNPKNLRECVVCEKPIKNYKESKGTCSHSCSNKHFAHLRNKPENYTHYRTICFDHHEKKCIVCGEEKIVSVHHINENHHDNRPENLVPLCPTHHQYVHSKYKDEVQPYIDEYLGVGKSG